MFDLGTNVCLSGGAAGADHAWGLMARDQGHDVIHWSFNGHRCADNLGVNTLTQAQLNVADSALITASKSIKRRWPSNNNHVNNLLRRNYYQVQWCDRVYAVSKLTSDSSQLRISGGTAWAAQMYVDRWYIDTTLKECELYLFDQNTNKWMQWLETWITIARPPRPYGVYAGIGSREITDAGIEAILLAYG